MYTLGIANCSLLLMIEKVDLLVYNTMIHNGRLECESHIFSLSGKHITITPVMQFP